MISVARELLPENGRIRAKEQGRLQRNTQRDYGQARETREHVNERRKGLGR